ncbi:hypothetical protein BDW42DRAFT_198068, partial [Aspergillus taichungensis]
SYFVRWVNVKSDHTISWSIQPHKKSINFGIFKHPGGSGVLSSSSSSLPTDNNVNGSNENLPATSARGNLPTGASIVDKLTGMGLRTIHWVGKCEAEKIVKGTYAVPPQEGGNYALVFDNTFSKQISKTVTLVLLTYPSALPPQAAPLPHATAALGVGPDRGDPAAVDGRRPPTTRRRGNSVAHVLPQPGAASHDGSHAHTGILHKRRRKRHQGWARRFFALDFATATLSYYHDRNASALRGSIPLSLAAVACNENSREISIDSGTEVWHLRAHSDEDFAAWKRALEKGASSKTAAAAAAEEFTHQPHAPSEPLLRVPSMPHAPTPSTAAEEREWSQVEDLVHRVRGSRDAVRRLAQETDPKYLTVPGAAAAAAAAPERPRGRSPSPHPVTPPEGAGDESAESRDRRPFWKRRNQGPPGAGPPAASVSDAVPTDASDQVHRHLMALLRDLDSVVHDFSGLMAASQQRRRQLPTLHAQPRASMESEDEFFDAVDDGDRSPLLTIHGDSDDEEAPTAGEAAAAAAAAAAAEAEDDVVDDDVPSDSEGDDEPDAPPGGDGRATSLFPAKPKSLTPLPLRPVSRRANITAPTVMPPSLIGFLRKNVGKDLSQISMPVSANEPLSLLQRAAEVLEYPALLDQAAAATDPVQRLLLVTAFALAPLSSNRVRERAIRKPFNPLLGETYELVREDLGFRFIAEKVSHRPVQLAYQADARDWSLAQAPVPTQKFWGKSAEIITEGKVRLTLHSTGERFSWSQATSFLRNIIAGEKYVEPVGEMTVLNESTGHKAISTFKAGGMFSGRSEEVSTKVVDPNGRDLPLGLAGTWTTSLSLTQGGTPTGGNNPLWTAGPLVAQAPKHYGLTRFAAVLNEITPIEDGHVPVTDSRLRPDQRALEDGDVDRAEAVKVRLEEGQRARRRDMEAAGESWTPRWFAKVADDNNAADGEAHWRLKTGKDGYWEERARGGWSGVVPVFEK